MSNCIRAVALTLVGYMALPSFAETTEQNVMAALEECASGADPGERLACFDLLAVKALQTINAPSSPTPAGADSTIGLESTDEMIANHRLAAAETFDPHKIAPLIDSKTLNASIRQEITKLQRTVLARWRISLENGQIWTQKDNRELGLAVGQEVVILRGSFGSFFLKKPQSNTRIRVKRIQ